MESMMIYVPIVMALIGLAFMAIKRSWVLKQDPGDGKMKEISDYIYEGALAFLKAEYRLLALFVVFASIALAGVTFIPGVKTHLLIVVAFIFGAFFSALAGNMGMKIATKTNVRTTQAARTSLPQALKVSFGGGTVMGLGVAGLAVLGLTTFFIIFFYKFMGGVWTDTEGMTIVLETLAGFSLGAESIALFARVGGGIYTKAADVGADLVGKIEAGIPEDDPRNPATIADNVGDNVGDCAGMGADLYETYVVTIIAAMLLALIPSVSSTYNNAIEYPLMLGCIAIVGSIIGTWFVKLGKSENIMGALYKGLIVSGIISAAGFYAVTVYTNNPLNLFLATVVGLVITILINVITEYYTSTKYKPVRKIAEASITGAGTNLISGLGFGLQSTLLPVLVICGGIIAAYLLAGIYGIAIAAVSMLSLTGVIIALDSYGPITDNAGGIAEMAGLDKKVRKTTDALDAVGNTTKAVTKGYAIGSAALGALALFAAFTQEISHVVTEPISFLITDPSVIVGLFIGALLPFVFSSVCMSAVGSSAHKIVVEVRRQFKEIKGLMEGKAKPEYGKCVDIVTKAALRNMIVPALIAIFAPLLVGMILGIKALGGLLIGVILSGLLLALFMANAGAAWDNAKKYIEDGNHGGKGSDAHKAAIVGDTVGDPFKDTAGPALNALIKVINTFAIVFAPLFVAYGLNLF